MRAATSAALQLAERSSIVAASALGKSPTGFRFRRQMCPLSRWVCTSTKSGSTMRPDIATSGASPKSSTPAGTILAMTTVVDEDVDDGETIKVDRRDGLWQHAAEDARLLQHIASGGGEERTSSAIGVRSSAAAVECAQLFPADAHANVSAPFISGADRGPRPCSRTAAYRPSCNRDRPSRPLP